MITQQTIYTTIQEAFAKEYPNYRWPKGDLEDQDPRFLRAMLIMTAGVNAAHQAEVDGLQNKLKNLDHNLTLEVDQNLTAQENLRVVKKEKESLLTIATTGWFAAFLLCAALIAFKIQAG